MRIVIIGGGIGGLTTALALRQAGFSPQVFEQAPALLDVGAAIAVWPNAMRVLTRLGLGAEMISRSGQIREARWLTHDGRVLKLIKLPIDDIPAVALHRADLQSLLLTALPSESITLGKRFTRFEKESDGVRAYFSEGDSQSCDVLICADGLHSAARAQLLTDGPAIYRGYATWRGIASIPQEQLPPFTAIEVYGHGGRFGMGPVGRGRTGWWATSNEAEGAAEKSTERQEKLLRLFRDWCDPVRGLIEATPTENIIRNVTRDRPPAARWGEGHMTLLGDAAQPVTPNLGQGGCLAIESAAVLARCLAKYSDVAQALRSYEARRRLRSERIGRYSALYGRIGQVERNIPMRVRNVALSAVPKRVAEKMLRWVFDYDAYGVEI